MASTKKTDPRITAFIDSFGLALEYCRPHWEQYARLYALWRNKRFEELESTYSKINLALFHATIQDRIPKLYENVFSTNRFLQVQGGSPRGELSAKAVEAFMLDLFRDKIKIQHEIWSTMQTTLIGGTAYRMPHVTYIPKGDTWEPRIYSKDVEFFHVLPAPGGGHVNPFDAHQKNAVPWVMVIDWWTEDKIRALAEKGVLEKEGVSRLLTAKKEDEFDEMQYRDKYATVGNLQYTADHYYRTQMDAIDDKAKRRRIVHWFRRDRHLVIGEDWVVLYDQPYNGVIPIAKYEICPDQNNWFGISYLQIQEDLIKAIVMNFNYRMDNLLGTMFPTTWIRQDILDHGRYTEQDFIPRPYDMKRFPTSMKNERINDAVFIDRREEVTPQTFMDEDRMKAFMQKVGGMAETTQSLGNVIGNKTATGVTSILAELSGRPNMESTIFEYRGLREEAMLVLGLAQRHVTDPTFFRAADAKDGFKWSVLDPDDLATDYTIQTRGTRYLAEKQQNFQKMLAVYPFWNQNPVWNQYELNRQSAEVADIFPDPDKMINPQMVESFGGDMAAMQEWGAAPQPGGMASSMDMNQQTRSVQNRTGPEPRTGRIAKAEAVR